jgi:CBS domain-containing protein
MSEGQEFTKAINKFTAKTINELTVADVMKDRLWDLPLIEKEADIIHVLALLSTRNHVWVVDTKKNMNLQGVITEHDIMGFLVRKKREVLFGYAAGFKALHHTSKKASDIMSRHLIKIKPTTTIHDALRMMALHRIRRLPVVTEGRLTAELTLQQILRLAARLEVVKHRRSKLSKK